MVAVEQDSSDKLVYTVFIPQDAMEKKSDFKDVTINSASGFTLPEHLQIEEIPDTIHVSPDGAWYLSKLIPKKDEPHNIILEKPITIPAKIMLERQSVLKWITGKIISKKL